MKLIIFILLSKLCFSNTIDSFEKFKHEIKGCPENSICTKEFGKKYLSFQKNLKKKKFESLKNSGIPLEVWGQNLKNPSKDYVYWESRCEHHRNSKNKIYSVEILAKSFSDLKKHSALSSRLIGTYLNDQAIIYPIVQKSIPFLSKGGNIYLTQERDGYYYTLSISPGGSFSILPNFESDKFAQRVNCSKKLIALYHNRIQKNETYQTYKCYNVWNADLKADQEFIVGQACL